MDFYRRACGLELRFFDETLGFAELETGGSMLAIAAHSLGEMLMPHKYVRPGGLIISPVAHYPSLQRMGVPLEPDFNVGGFSSGQRRFLEYHRDAVLLSAALSRRE